MTWAGLVRVAPTDQGPFSEHLRHHHWLLHKEPVLRDALRQIIFPGGTEDAFLSLNTEIMLLSGLCVMFMVLSRYALRYMENLGKRTGRLTLRWQ